MGLTAIAGNDGSDTNGPLTAMTEPSDLSSLARNIPPAMVKISSVIGLSEFPVTSKLPSEAMARSHPILLPTAPNCFIRGESVPKPGKETSPLKVPVIKTLPSTSVKF